MNKTIEGVPFWVKKSDSARQYPWLSEMENCEVAIIGGGLTGAMCAYRFATAGIDTVLVTASPIGYGMTAVTCGVALSEHTRGLSGLEKTSGNIDKAVRINAQLKQSIENIEKFGGLDSDASLIMRDTFYYSTAATARDDYFSEYRLRMHNGIKSKLYDDKSAADEFSFPLTAGIYSTGSAIEYDPYKLTHMLICKAAESGARIYENTKVVRVGGGDMAKVLYCNTKNDIIAKKVIYACGCGSLFTPPKPVHYKTLYTFVSEPVEGFSGWKSRCVICCNGEDEFIMRTTDDNRIVMSGYKSKPLGDKVMCGGLMSAERFAMKRYDRMEEQIREMFKGIREIKPAFKCAAPVIETAGGMPMIGCCADEPDAYFAISGTDNGAVSELAGRMILDMYSGKSNKDIELFSPQNCCV